MKFFFQLLLLSLTISVQSQSREASLQAPHFTQTFTTEQYIEDLDQLTQNLTNKHPRPFAHISEKDFWTLVKRKKEQVNNKTTYPEFIWMCSEIIASIGCSHTNLQFFNQESKVLPIDRMMPLEAQLIEGRLHITNPLINKDRLQVGEEIFAINGIDIETIKQGVFKHISADANNPTGKIILFNGFFSFYIPYYLGFPKSYDILLRTHQNPTPLKQLEDYQFTRHYLYPSNCQKAYCFEPLDEDKSALLTINSFYFGEESASFYDFLHQNFRSLREQGLQNLIIDLRKNSGGPGTHSAELLSYIAQSPFTYFNQQTDYGPQYKSPIPPNEWAFQGKVFLLIGHENGSSANHFLSLVKQHQWATLIGAETAGTFTCNDNSHYYRLPNTGISVRNATSTFTTTATQFSPLRGIFPDHPVQQTLADYLKEKDTVLTYTLNLLSQP
ncbi:MAG: S41 family peptidase [Bacteroidota bacterium]